MYNHSLSQYILNDQLIIFPYQWKNIPNFVLKIIYHCGEYFFMYTSVAAKAAIQSWFPKI